MTYGHSPRAPAEFSVVERALNRAAGTWGGYQAWRRLTPDDRLELIERALNPANDRIDGYPLAL